MIELDFTFDITYGQRRQPMSQDDLSKCRGDRILLLNQFR